LKNILENFDGSENYIDDNYDSIVKRKKEKIKRYNLKKAN
jgi:hypothetical protein